MREIIGFDCQGDRLAGTLDHANGRTGLLIVSGGNEIRIGAHRGMAMLAQRVAASGHPVLRYDRRGIGDSEGDNRGFRQSADDIAAAAQAFRQLLPVDRIVGFGNCDAATALALFHSRAGIDALLLANPWVIEKTGDLPSPAAIRARYSDRLRDPRQWLRLARGGVHPGKLIKGLLKSVKKSDEGGGELPTLVATSLKSASIPTSILLADGDNTAIAFQDAFKGETFSPVRERAKIAVCRTSSHSFARKADADWLFERVMEALGPS